MVVPLSQASGYCLCPKRALRQSGATSATMSSKRCFFDASPSVLKRFELVLVAILISFLACATLHRVKIPHREGVGEDGAIVRTGETWEKTGPAAAHSETRFHSSLNCAERQKSLDCSHVVRFGAIAQLVARFLRMEEVGGSTPPSSTRAWRNGRRASFRC